MPPFYALILIKLLIVELILHHVVFAKEHYYYSSSEEIGRRSERTWTDDFKDYSRKEITIHSRSGHYFSRDRRGNYIYFLKYKSENVPKRSHVKQIAKQTESSQSQTLKSPFLKDFIRHDRGYDGSSCAVAEFNGKNHNDLLSKSFTPPSMGKPSFLNLREATNGNRDYDQTVLLESQNSNIYRGKRINNSPLIVPISHNYPSSVRFPLFFINPGIQIIYAITEVGKWQEEDKAVPLNDYNSEIDNKNKNNDNNDNKIFNQEKDKDLLKQENPESEQDTISFDENFNRKNLRNLFLLLTQSGNLQETKKNFDIPCSTSKNKLASLLPLSLSPSSSQSSSPPTITALSPTSSHRMHSIPPPILVKTELTVQDHLAPLPFRRNPTTVKTKKLQRKRKKKFKKRPGRHPAASTTFVETFPKVITGKRHPIVFSPPQEAEVRTQLEKPLSLPLTVSVDNLRSYEFMKNISGNFQSERRREENNHRFRREAIYEDFDTIKTIETNAENVPLAKQQQTTNLSTITTTTTTTMIAKAAPVKELLKNNEKSKIMIKKSQPEVFKLGSIKRLKRKRHNSSKQKKQNQNDYDYFDLYEEDDEEDEEEIDEEEEYDNSKEYDNDNDDDDEKDDHNRHKYKSKHKQKNRHKVPGMRVKKRPGVQKINEKDLNESQQNDSYDSGGALQESNSKLESESSMEESIEYNSHSEIIEDSVASSEVGEGVEEYDLDSYQGEQVSQEEEEEEEDEEQEEDENEYENVGDGDYSIVKPTQTKQNTDHYDDDDDDDDESGIGGIGAFLNTLFYPLHLIMEKIFGYESSPDTKNSNGHQPENSYSVDHNNRYPQPSSENESHENDDDENDGSSLFDRFSSWLGLSWRTTKKIDTSIGTPSSALFDHSTTEKPSNWLQSWFSYDYETTTPEPPEETNNEWFSGWFNTKNRRGTKPPRPPPPHPPLTTEISHIPILTIVDPMRNPQSWIGLLAHQITNGTATTNKPSMSVINNRPSAATSNSNMFQRRNYNKYQIWRLKPQNDGETKVLEDYKRSGEGNKLQWLKRPTLRGLNDVLIPPKMLTDFAATLRYESIAHEVIIFDVGKVIAYEKSNSAQHLAKFTRQTIKYKQKSKSFSMSWQKYYQYDDIVKYLESIRSRYPQIVELIHIGRSYEGRPLIICKIKSKETAGSDEDSSSSVKRKRLKFKKKSGHANAIFIESGTHGMEWIGPATSTWMISELLRIMKSNSKLN